MLNYDKAILIRADEVITGDTLDTKCGVADLAWEQIVKVHVEEYRYGQDRMRFTLNTDGLSRTRTFNGSSMVRVIPNGA